MGILATAESAVTLDLQVTVVTQESRVIAVSVVIVEVEYQDILAIAESVDIPVTAESQDTLDLQDTQVTLESVAIVVAEYRVIQEVE